MINYSENDKMYHIGVGREDVGKYVILTGDPKRCAKIAEYFDDARLAGDNREFVTYTGTLDGVRVSVTSTGIGGPSTAIAMEELVMCGCHTFIRVGTSGGICLDVKSGDIVVATGAIRMDGTSKEYAPIEFPAVADFETVFALTKAAKKNQASYHTGVVQCKDAFYGQHKPEELPNSAELLGKWNAWCRLNTLASEMESSTIFVVGSYLRVRTGAVLMVMSNQERVRNGLSNPIVHDTDLAIRTAVEAIRILIADDKSAEK